MAEHLLTLNEGAKAVAHLAFSQHVELKTIRTEVTGTHIALCGGAAAGSLEAGEILAMTCLAGRGRVELAPPINSLPFPRVQVWTDDPVRACLASQYAGWQVKTDDYFAMASGPMRAMSGREKIFDSIPGRETGEFAVGVLEAKQVPTESAIAAIRSKLPPNVTLTLLVAPAASIAGSYQVVARSVETALHKLYELGFDVNQVRSGYGVAPLPPVARKEMDAIGRTNDAILYGGQVTLWVDCEDDQLRELGPKVPSSASADYGAPFAEIFRRYDGDFYKIDPSLFSPAEITFINLRSGRAFHYGACNIELLRHSFLGAE
jgi:methenyltetrahydromethanopterin cyclohydrolase